MLMMKKTGGGSELGLAAWTESEARTNRVGVIRSWNSPHAFAINSGHSQGYYYIAYCRYNLLRASEEPQIAFSRTGRAKRSTPVPSITIAKDTIVLGYLLDILWCQHSLHESQGRIQLARQRGWAEVVPRKIYRLNPIQTPSKSKPWR